MGTYELEIADSKVKASVIDNAALMESIITELRSLIQKPVVGFDVKFGVDPNQREAAKLLILYAENRCLIIQLEHLDSVPESLKQFLADETICFLGMEIDKKIGGLWRYCLSCMTGSVEVGDMAARVLKRPNISTFSVSNLCKEAGLTLVTAMGLPEKTPDWNASIFAYEKIKEAIREARSCYIIGEKLLGKLDL